MPLLILHYLIAQKKDMARASCLFFAPSTGARKINHVTLAG
jgi:hypothetical protein